MTKKKNKGRDNGPQTDFSKVAAHVHEISLADEIENSFLSYSYMVILSRAIPDVRDGLKPVHRRILYGMHDAGTLPSKPYVKVARITGNVMGSLHPHGDSAISDALVRLGQDFSMRTPLIDGYGNYGLPGVAPAAGRYIEGRLARAALPLLAGLNEKTVKMRPNYDATSEEPEVLPASFPNLLINGGSGIAVGMATNIPQHCPDEVMKATKYLLRNPNATLSQIMRYIPGPDFATGGVIVGIDQVKEAYKTGRGTFRIRGKYTITPSVRGRHEIIFTELPFESAPSAVIQKVKEAIKAEKLTGLFDAKDLTDRRNGTKLVFETKAAVKPEIVLAELFKLTPLEVSFGANHVAIVDGKPQTLGLLDMLREFLKFRKEVVLNRTSFRKAKAEKRLHIVKGVLKALIDIDLVIKIVRTSETDLVAKDSLMKKLKIDDLQAEYVLDIPLRRLTKLNKLELEQERDRLSQTIKELTKVLKDPKALEDLIYEELEETQKAIASPRRSEISGVSLEEHLQEAKAVISAASDAATVENEPCVISLTARGNLQRSDNGLKKLTRQDLVTNTHSHLVAVTNKGRGLKFQALHVLDKETKPEAVLPDELVRGERIIAIAPAESESAGGVAIGTEQGVVKITSPQWPKTRDVFDVITLKAGDKILSASWVESPADYEFVFITEKASMLAFPADKVRPQGLSGGGVAGIGLKGEVKAISFNAVKTAERDRHVVVTATSDRIKATPFKADLYPNKGRAGGGYGVYSFRKGEGELEIAGVVPDGALLTDGGQQVALPKLVNKRVASGEPR